MIDTDSVGPGFLEPPSKKFSLRCSKGRKLPFKEVMKSRSLELFYSVPGSLRRELKIPQWFAETIGVPKYYFRTPGKTFSPKQVCISTLGRLYYMYRYSLKRGNCNTATLARGSKGDSIYHLFYLLSHSRRWYTVCHMIYRRLKVLLSPN